MEPKTIIVGGCVFLILCLAALIPSIIKSYMHPQEDRDDILGEESHVTY